MLHRFLMVVLFALSCAILQTASQAGEKEKKDKAVELKFKDGAVSVNTSLGAKDPLYKEKRPHKLYAVNLEEGKTYQIDMISKDQQSLDPYLFLLNPEGKEVASDDDGGGELQSRIVYKATKAGRYRIVCTHFGDVGTGDFTLSVKLTEK